MAATRAPKQWSLTKNETITSFEAWRQNLKYTLSLDPNFAIFLVDGTTWTKKVPANPTRGLTDDGEEVPAASRRNAAQKVAHLELKLGQIANYCPIISRNVIIKQSTSVEKIWQAIRMHFGFQLTGAHFLDFDSIHLEPGERAEDLYQRLTSFIDDNLLQRGGGISHHGEMPEADEELSPSLENLVILTWLRLVHKDLPALVKQRYGPELRSKTLASLKPEISQALDSLLDDIRSNNDAKVLRTSFKGRPQFPSSNMSKDLRKISKSCPLCKQAGRPRYDHFLSACRYLPPEDRQFMSRARQSFAAEEATLEPDSDDFDNDFVNQQCDPVETVPTTRRVSTKQSPHMKAYYNQHVVHITVDSGAEISMIRASIAEHIGVQVNETKQHALQADGSTPLETIGETHFDVVRDNLTLRIEALVVKDLDVDILAGIPFMSANDISIRPAKHLIMVGDNDAIQYNCNQNSNVNHIRRTQAYILRSPSTTVWPGDHIDIALPEHLPPEGKVAIEPRMERSNKTSLWPRPEIVDVVAGKVRLVNDTDDPKHLNKNEQFCQVLPTMPCDTNRSKIVDDRFPPKRRDTASPVRPYHSDSVNVDPDHILSVEQRELFRKTLRDHDNLFDPQYKGYNGAVGDFQATINMGPTQPPQRKGRLPQYSDEKLVILQQKCDELESLGVIRKPEDLSLTVEYLNPPFLVAKPNGGHRLVTAFEDVGRYSKPQPSLMPDIDSILRKVGQWKYLIVADLTSAFHQIPLSRQSLKYCGLVTPYKGVRV